MEKEKPLVVPPTGTFPPPPSPPQSVTFNNDLNSMPENPPKNTSHRRAHSEILGDGAGGAGMSFSDDTEEGMFSMYMDMVNLATSPGFTFGKTSSEQVVGHGRHQHSQSLDSLMTIGAELFAGGSEGGGGLSASEKNAMFEARYAELALVDPKRAKRLMSNRQYAVRYKDRQKKYVEELERKVESLQTETTTLSSQLNVLQNETKKLISTNKELKIRLQGSEHQGQLQDALNDALRKEIQLLIKLNDDQAISNGGPSTIDLPVLFSPSQLLSQNSQAVQNDVLTAQQFQQLHLHSRNQQHSFQPHQLHPQQFQQQNLIHQNQIRPSM